MYRSWSGRLVAMINYSLNIVVVGKVRRRCIGEDVWEEFNECISEEINILMEEVHCFVLQLLLILLSFLDQ